MEKIKISNQVLCAMGDDISKEMYIDRIAYSNGDNKAMERIIHSVMFGEELLQFMDKNEDDLYIFGAGMLGTDFASTWKWKYRFKGFIDNNNAMWGRKVVGLPVLALEDINKDHTAVIIMNKFCYKEILEQLINFGLKNEQILNTGKIYRQFNKRQYFDLDCMEITDRENFVDCGVFDGETSLNLYERWGVNKIWMFEPDKQNIPKIKRNFENVEKIDYEIIERGVWSSETTLRFNSLGNGCSEIDSKGGDSIKTVRLDMALGDGKPTFIKMDIEGAELEALKGAEQVIKKYRPKLAISVYHKMEDIDEIPKLILAYNPNYKLYLRHYSLMSSETILYAL